jgi:hypothetical protein
VSSDKPALHEVPTRANYFIFFHVGHFGLSQGGILYSMRPVPLHALQIFQPHSKMDLSSKTLPVPRQFGQGSFLFGIFGIIFCHL